MISAIFDLMLAGFVVLALFVFVQFKTGFMVNRSVSLFGYSFEVKGEKGKTLAYRAWKTED